MSRRPTAQKLQSKVGSLFNTFSEKKLEAESKRNSDARPVRPQKRKMGHYLAGKDTRKANRLQQYVACGLWPEGKPEPTYV